MDEDDRLLEKRTPPPPTGPGVGRTIALTDAVVAIAMTLLVLPLVEVTGDVDTTDLTGAVSDHGDLLVSFAVSFVVIYVFWAAHGTALRRLEDADDLEVPGWRGLNLLWLLVIAFLPFPTALVGQDLNTTTAPIYIGTMFVLSVLTSAIIVVTDRAVGGSGRGRWAWLTTAVFGACALLSAVNADLGMFALLVLAVVRVVETRAARG
ncbi:TMEM175 family protein [Nocardioides sp.]|uniref:TMEM175 family protein n=1 Tax=Nocardioides sp. TaxID=35761 RepID=UPI0037841CCC